MGVPGEVRGRSKGEYDQETSYICVIFSKNKEKKEMKNSDGLIS